MTIGVGLYSILILEEVTLTVEGSETRLRCAGCVNLVAVSAEVDLAVAHRAPSLEGLEVVLELDLSALPFDFFFSSSRSSSPRAVCSSPLSRNA